MQTHRLDIWIDRIAALLMLGFSSGICLIMLFNGDLRGLFLWPVAQVYCFSLALGRWWSYLVFGILTVPTGFYVFVLGEMGNGRDVIHDLFEFPGIWPLIAVYGPIRAVTVGIADRWKVALGSERIETRLMPPLP